MRSIRDVAGQELSWEPSQTAKYTYELRAGDEVLATLRQESRWGQRRVAETAEGAWIFDKRGVWRPQTLILDVGSGAEAARLARSGWSGKATLDLPSGRHYLWRATNIWRSRWEWQDTQGLSLARMTMKQGFAKTRGTVEIDPLAAATPDLALLVPLGWHLMLVARAEAAAASASVAGV